MTLKEVSELTGIPYDTLLRWNSAKQGNYRRSLARFLKDADRSALIKYFGYKAAENKPSSLKEGL